MEIKTVSGEELTTLGIGGEFTVFFPETVSEVADVVRNEEVFVIGGGSNLVLPENNSQIKLLSLSKLKKFAFSNSTLICGAGVTISEILNFQLNREFSLFEFLAGVPKITVGGAVAQNAGAFGRETVDFLKSVTFVDWTGKIQHLTDFSSFGYRTSPFPKSGIVCEVEFSVRKNLDVKELIKNFVRDRLKKHPPFYLKTAGSTFKNPGKFPAGLLIEKAGLKGFSVGGIKISEIHGNFLINSGKGTFSDFCKIVDVIREKVFINFGIELELEVKVPGFNF